MLAQRAPQPRARRGEHAAAAAEFAALEIGGFLDALRGIDEDEAMPETAMEKDRQPDIGMAAIARHVVAAEVEFAGIAFGIPVEPPMPVARRRRAEHREIDAVSLDTAFLEWTHDLVIAA